MTTVRSISILMLGLLAAGVAAFLLTITLTGALPLPWSLGSATTQARTIALEGGSLGPVAEPPAIPAPGGGNPLVNFQGRLTNPGTGLPVANGSYSITFRIFEVPAGGSTVWTETQSVSVNGGLFNVLLGSVTPLDAGVFSATNRYLEVQVSPDPPLSPRLQFGYVPYAFQAEQAGAASRLGFSLTTVDGAGDVGVWTSVTVGTDGLPVVSYQDGTNADLKVAHCGNTSCSAGNTVTTVDSLGFVGAFTSVTVGADGLPVISYYDATNGNLKVAHCDNAACTHACGGGTTCTTVDSSVDDVGLYTSITIGAESFPVISYLDFTNGNLKVAHCGNALCSTACGVGGTTCTTVDSVGGVVNTGTSVTVGVDGLPVISYHDVTNGDLKVAHCGDASCSAGNTLTTVDSAGDVGVWTSVTVGTDGLPVVSYQDGTNADLKVAHCGNTSCSAGNTVTTVDSLGFVGAFTAVTVGADGLPLVTYNGQTNGAMKVAHCGNVLCNTGNTLTTVDTVGFPGVYYTSITVGTEGLPVISYYDVTNGDLKVAHCSNRFCMPWHRPR